MDGAGQKPAYNLRTLSRALDYARGAAPSYGMQRALYDGVSMAFLTQVRINTGASWVVCREAGCRRSHASAGKLAVLRGSGC